MNIIEQFGSYENAKQKYSERPFDLAWSDIGQALLEYRRENNIFEVGDLASCKQLKQLFKVSRFDDDNLVVESLRDGRIYRVSPGFMKHATTQEIEASRRL